MVRYHHQLNVYEFEQTLGDSEGWGSLEILRCRNMTKRFKVLLLLFSCSVLSDSFWPHGLQLARLLYPGDFPDKNIGVGYHFLLHQSVLNEAKRVDAWDSVSIIVFLLSYFLQLRQDFSLFFLLLLGRFFGSLKGTWFSEDSLRKTREKWPKIVWKIVLTINHLKIHYVFYPVNGLSNIL